MSSDAVKTLVQAFISCRLDYCNSMFYGIMDGLMSRLQSVQNALRCLCVTPVLQELHWLSVQRRVDFKMATLVYLSLSGMAAAYLAADSQLVSDEGRRQLRSANSRSCVVRRTCSSYGNKCFAAAVLRLWNKLSAHLRQTGINFKQFKRLLIVKLTPPKSSYSLTYLLTN